MAQTVPRHMPDGRAEGQTGRQRDRQTDRLRDGQGRHADVHK